jgi:hypothetical protein
MRNQMRLFQRILLLLGLAALCAADVEPAVREVGRIHVKSLNEASGLIRSRSDDGLYWTHNDGNDAAIYAIHADGTVIARLKVNAKFRDFEDIAADADGNLYLGDIGDNKRQRKHVTVYRISEPEPRAGAKVAVIDTWKLRLPGGACNCESLFVRDEYGYVISKRQPGERAIMYRFSLRQQKEQTLETVCELPIDRPVTAADISADGRWLAVLSQQQLTIFQVGDDISKVSIARTFPIPPIQAEGCCFNSDGVLVIAESGEILQVKLELPPPATTRATR